MSDAVVRSICAEFDVEIIPANEMPVPGQTRAAGTLSRILAKHGDGHLRLVLATLSETKGNQGLITETSLWATSDLVRACSKWIEEDASAWFDAWDKIPLGFILWHVQELAGKSHMRHALAGAMYLMLVHYSRGKKADREVGYGFIRRVQKAEDELSARQVNRSEAVEMGRELIALKASMPRGEWLPWVRERSGMSYGTVQRYMRLAAEARS
ncbi:DUF3102 domain-containing protein [Sinorhizobium americanum]|uniref:DUF3102 family protein n=1 Tax=Sinorhizobium americanum TaxID=194963 RepID=A0A4R2BRD2_9HYPH|nr:DUF3102 domain-containing protein [Sinorhizobium americanum]TCN30141.1 DUF3102 family protein [Sinorhizobium americanum]